MDASFKTIVHRFSIGKGVLQENPRTITVVEGSSVPGSRRSRGNLYILIETLGNLPDPDYVVKRLAEVIQSKYYQASGSVTGGINAALRAANDLLFEENLNAPREQRGVAGVSCAVLRDGDLYLGQIGPAVAYLAQPDGLRRFPEDSPWLRQAIPSEAERAASPPLGVRRVIEPLFYHAQVSAGDVLVLASPTLSRLASSRSIAEMLAQGVTKVQQQLQTLAADRSLSVLMITLADAGAPEEEEEELVELEASEAEPQAAPSISRLRSIPKPEAEPKPAGGLLALLGRILPDRTSKEPKHPQAAAPARTNGRTVAILAVLVPILALSLVLVTRYQYERSRRQQVVSLLKQAEEARQSGESSGQKDSLRQGLQQAVHLIDQALQIAPQDSTALRLRQEVIDQLDVVSGVQRLYTLWELADFSAGGTAPAELTRIVVRGNDVFVLDRAGGRVYRRLLTPAGDALQPPTSEAVLVQKGETRGGIVVGDLLDMLWMPAGGSRKVANLLILERNGSLLEWDATRGITVLPVADSAAWKKPQAAGAFFGNFYLLDPAQNRILKYVPTADGYTSPPVDYLANPSEVNLGEAVDMAIDGHIYVLGADGTIQKLLAGKPQPFPLSELDVPLNNPVAIAVTGEDEAHGSVYVADAGLARVVQFTKQGQFVRQFKAGEGQATLARLHGLFVDESRQRIFLASGSKLYVAPLTQPGASPAATATPTSSGS